MPLKWSDPNDHFETTSNPPTSSINWTAFGRHRRTSVSGFTEFIFAVIRAGFADYVGFRILGGGGLVMEQSTGTTTLAATPPPAGEWFSWYVQCQGTAIGDAKCGYRMDYDDAWTSVSSAFTAVSFTPDMVIVGSLNNLNYGLAEMSDIRLWDAVLTISELSNERLSQFPVRRANLRYDFRLDDINDKGKDSSGNGFNITSITGTTTPDTRTGLWSNLPQRADFAKQPHIRGPK